MKPVQVLLILRAHYRVALVVFVLAMSAGIAISFTLPKRYTTGTSLVFDIKATDPVAGSMLPITAGYLATQIDIIRSDRVGQQVVSLLKLDQNPNVRKQWKEATNGKVKLDIWLAEYLSNGISVTASKGSSVLTIECTAGDPSFATAVANAYAQIYIDANIELKVDPSRQYARWFSEQGKVMRENLEKAQARLSEFQQEKGIVAKDEQMDVEMRKFDALSAQLSTARGQTVDVLSKEHSAKDAFPEGMQSALTQNLKGEIARGEAKLKEVSENLGRNHPQYIRMEAELDALKQQLALEKSSIASGISTSRAIAMDLESRLRADLATQKKKLLELKNDRDKLAVLQRDVDAAQSAYDGVTRRFNQTSLESQVTQANVSILNFAQEPVEPSSPNLKKNILVSIVGGLFLGVAVAYLLELIDRRIRSVHDLSEMLQVPVLAVVERPRKNSRLITATRRRMAFLLK